MRKKATFFLAILLFYLISPLSSFSKESPGDPAKRVCILVHGFLRTKYSMHFMEKEIANEGYLVINTTYPSGEYSIEGNADYINDTIEEVIRGIDGDYELYFVTHSMGALVMRCYLDRYQPRNAVRMVMIAPPNRGAAKAEIYSDFLLFDNLLGPSGMEMARGGGFLSKLCGGAPDIEFGIIAGGKGDGEGYSSRIEGDDDGTISVWATYMPETKDFLLLDHYHTFICHYKDVIENTKYFFEHGEFLMHTAPPE